jgi:hypothetical protein
MNAQYEWLQELLKEGRFQPTCAGDPQPAVQLADQFEEYVLPLNTLSLIAACVDRTCRKIRSMCKNHRDPRDGGVPVDNADEMMWKETAAEDEEYLVWTTSFNWPKRVDGKSCDFDCETVFKAFLNSEDCELNTTCTMKSFMHPLLTYNAGVKDHHLMRSGKLETECGTAEYTAKWDDGFFGVSVS